MDNVIAEYQKWKQQGQTLRTHAKQAMEARFRDLLTEAAQVAQEYQHDFGVALKPPPSITAFRYKTAAGKPQAKTKKAEPALAEPQKTVNPKIAPLEKRLAQARERRDSARQSGRLNYRAARCAFTAAPITAISVLVGTTSKTLPCSGVIVTISCRYWLSRLTLINLAFGPDTKNFPGPSR